ncbi:ATP-grasp fold amidoligase family protein [Vreelandella alkaliphila]
MTQSKMTFSMVKNIENDLSKGDSFVSSLITLRKIKEYLRRLGLNIAVGQNYKTKQQDLAFASSLGVRVPSIYQEGCSYDELILLPNTVIKPARGSSSRGCFIVDGDLNLRSVKTGKIYIDKSQAWSEVEDYIDFISLGEWQVEEFISKKGKPAHDLKVCCFYGVPGFYLEIDRSSKPVKSCLYDSDQKFVSFQDEPGFYISENMVFKGKGVPQEAVELSRIISLNSPVPLLRIDFLVGDDGLYLGEITPNPGRYAGAYSDKLDNTLGTFFNKSWARLLADLIAGKRFDIYQSIYGGKNISVNFKSFPLPLLSQLSDSSRSFKKKNTRHTLRSQGLIYSSFSVGEYCVPRELAQRDAKTRIDQFGLMPCEWEGKRVLDLGCNNGAMLFHLTNYGIADGLGIEYDTDKVNVTQEINEFLGVDHLRFQQGDIDTLEAESIGTFDIVMALAIEAHVNNPERLFQLLGRVTERVLCFEGNSRCDIDATRKRLLACGFKQVEYKGFCIDDVVVENNKRPVLIAWK